MNLLGFTMMAAALSSGIGQGAAEISQRDQRRYAESHQSAGRIERAIVRRERVSQAKARKRRRRTGR